MKLTKFLKSLKPLLICYPWLLQLILAKSNSKTKTDQIVSKNYYAKNSEEKAFYNPDSLFSEVSDLVTEFDAYRWEFFKEKFYYSKKPWIIIFYAHWCGHSQSLAKIIKPRIQHLLGYDQQNSNNYKNWKDFIQIGVIDCAFLHESNRKVTALKLCKLHGNVLGYPTVKFFNANVQYHLENFEIFKDYKTYMPDI